MADILEFIQGLNPVLQALAATCFTWAMVMLGAAAVFVAKDIMAPQYLVDSCNYPAPYPRGACCGYCIWFGHF